MDLSPRELEMLRLLQHARGCDGVECEVCVQIDLRLMDGPHAVEDPTARHAIVDGALVKTAAHVERIYAHLEGSSVPASIRRSVHQVTEALEQIRQLLRLPLLRSAREGAPPTPPTRRGPPPRRPLR